MNPKLRLIRRAVYDKKTGCLISSYSKNIKNGYAKINICGQYRLIHRTLLEFKLRRSLGSDELAIHKCNNKGCISTAKGHVTVGSYSENLDDALRVRYNTRRRINMSHKCV